MMHSCCCICFIMWCGSGFYLIWVWKFSLNGFGNKFKWEKKKKEETLPAARWPGGPSVSNRAGLLFPFLFGPSSRAAVPLHSFLGSAWAGPGAAAAARLSSLASLTGRTHKSAASSPPCRNQAGHELDLHRIKLDFPGILTQVEVSQPHIS
jgi:hypothetical protein